MEFTKRTIGALAPFLLALCLAVSGCASKGTPGRYAGHDTGEYMDTSGTCAHPRSLEVRPGWTIWGLAAQPGSVPGREWWPIGKWYDHGTSIEWCPPAITAGLNVSPVPATLDGWAVTGDWNGSGFCNDIEIDTSMFVGNTPAREGCITKCIDGYPNLLCAR